MLLLEIVYEFFQAISSDFYKSDSDFRVQILPFTELVLYGGKIMIAISVLLFSLAVGAFSLFLAVTGQILMAVLTGAFLFFILKLVWKTGKFLFWIFLILFLLTVLF